MPWLDFSGSGSGPSTVHSLAGAMIFQHPSALGRALFYYAPPSSLKPSKMRSRGPLGADDLRLPAEMTFASGTG